MRKHYTVILQDGSRVQCHGKADARFIRASNIIVGTGKTPSKHISPDECTHLEILSVLVMQDVWLSFENATIRSDSIMAIIDDGYAPNAD